MDAAIVQAAHDTLVASNSPEFVAVRSALRGKKKKPQIAPGLCDRSTIG
jgi:hypothetical protein